jgi:hypothetical protein
MSQNDKAKIARSSAFMHALRMSKCAYGIRAEDIAERCGVSVSTARRWKAGTSQIPATAAAILLGELGAFSGSWRGWLIQGEEIVSPDGWRISRNDALAVPLLHGQIAAMRQRIKELEALTDEQPVPGAWPDKIEA